MDLEFLQHDTELTFDRLTTAMHSRDL